MKPGYLEKLINLEHKVKDKTLTIYGTIIGISEIN